MSAIAAETQTTQADSQKITAYEVGLDVASLQPAPKQRRNLQKRLQTAFTAFTDISEQLTSSYLELEQRVGELQSELVQTDQARLREFSAKEVLAERLDIMLNAMPVAVILLDGRGVVAKANSNAEQLLQIALLGEKWIDVINQSFSPQPADGHEVLLKNGRLVSIATQSLNNEPGQIIVITDQTEARLLQKKLNHNRKLSEMGKMTASLAHQIRTPLATATLYADHLGSRDLSKERRIKYADKLKARLIQLEKQVQDMLIFSKGGISLNKNLTVNSLLKILKRQVSELAVQRDIELVWFDFDTYGQVRCNPDLLLSVFTNLFDNAVEACVNSGINPSVHVRISKDGKGFLNLEMQDNGPGMKFDVSQRAMEPFFTTKSTGTGLGLAVTNAVVEAHGGYFKIFNVQKGGACSRIVLPLLDSAEKEGEEK